MTDEEIALRAYKETHSKSEFVESMKDFGFREEQSGTLWELMDYLVDYGFLIITGNDDKYGPGLDIQ